MEQIKLETDYGFDSIYKKWNGKFLTDECYDQIISPTEDTAVYKPGASLYDSTPLVYIMCNIYNEDKDNILNCLKTIEDTSKMRANAAGPILDEDMKSRGIEEYRLRTPNSYQVKTKAGKWGLIAYANEIHSVMAGWKRGRFTGKIEESGWSKDNADKFNTIKNIQKYNEKAFEKADSKRYIAQKVFAENSILPEHRVGIVTTFSMNRYSDLGLGSGGMSCHIDSGDNEQGMTTMCHFRDGDYDGAYLTWPRYGVAINAPHNSVIIADSLELHGVTPIKGKGTRYTCVAYCDRRLATKGQLGKTEKKIGKVKDSSSLDEFF